MLFQAFLQYIKQNNIISPGTSVLAAVSGGADSVCLLQLLTRLRSEWGLKVYCAHVNHGIRDTAARDEEHVRALCEEWNVPFFVKHADVPKIAAERKMSEELAGREVRYAFFEELCAAHGIDAVVTAHNMNDQAETVLMHLLRGSGMHGLTGIAPLRGKIGHPFLCFKRCEIEEYLSRNGIKWIEDETNALSIYRRNRVRNEIFPLLREINPEAAEAIASCADILRAEDEYMTTEAQKTNAVKYEDNCVFIDTKILETCADAIKNRIFYLALRRAGVEINGEDIKRLYALSNGAGRRATLSSGLRAALEYGRIAIYKEENVSFCYTLEAGKPLYIPELGKTLTSTCGGSPARTSITVNEGDKICVRTRRDGDIFTPEGGPGSKKLKDYFIDEKIPRRLRNKVPIITVNDKIAYILPLRRDSAFVPRDGERYITIHINEG